MPLFRVEDPYLTPVGAWVYFGGVVIWVAAFVVFVIDAVL